MKYEEIQASSEDGSILAELRVTSMKDSLTAIGRFDPERARERFLSTFSPKNTTKILHGEELVGFFVVELLEGHLSLAHLYVHPEFQGSGIGGSVLSQIKQFAHELRLPIRLGALRGSRSNQFYCQHGFRKTHEEEWDIYYEYVPS